MSSMLAAFFAHGNHLGELPARMVSARPIIIGPTPETIKRNSCSSRRFPHPLAPRSFDSRGRRLRQVSLNPIAGQGAADRHRKSLSIN